MPTPISVSLPYGGTPRGFGNKNMFADQVRLLAGKANVIFDVGALDGDEAATYRTVFPEARVHTVEPTPARAHALKEAFRDDPSVVIHECALCAHDGPIVFHTSAFDAANSLLPFDASSAVLSEYPALNDGHTIHVAGRTLDSLCAEHHIEQIDVLKLDVQGAELSVLAGAQNVLATRRVRLIYTELIFVPFYQNQASAAEILTHLQGFGYQLYDFYNFAHADSGQLRWGDAIFLRRG
jgi:FkbM family methyltransferase